VHAVERIGEAEPIEHPPGIILAGIGEDELAPRQPIDRRDQGRIGGDPGKIDVVDIIEEFVRIDAMIGHEAGEGRAMLVEETLLHPVRLGRVDAEQLLDIGAHAPVDQLEQVAAVRIEAVVEIEDPAFDMGEVGGHACALAEGGDAGKSFGMRPLLDCENDRLRAQTTSASLRTAHVARGSTCTMKNAGLAWRAAFALALVAICAGLPAQPTGSRIGRTAQNGNVDDAELALEIMARCVASRRPDLVRRWMALLPGTAEERQLVLSQVDDLGLCTESNELVLAGHEIRFQPRLLRRPLALAVVRRRLAQTPAVAPVGQDAEPWFSSRIAGLGPDAALDRGSLATQDFGHCVVLHAWPDARALFAAALDSAEEASVVQRLTPVLGPCLSEGVTINITRRNLRLILAEPFYHLIEPAGAASQN